MSMGTCSRKVGKERETSILEGWEGGERNRGQVCERLREDCCVSADEPVSRTRSLQVCWVV